MRREEFEDGPLGVFSLLSIVFVALLAVTYAGHVGRKIGRQDVCDAVGCALEDVPPYCDCTE